MKKIVCVVRSLGSGGAQKALVYVANLLAKTNNYEVSLIVLYRSEITLSVDESIQIVNCPYTKEEFSNSSLLKRKMMQLKNLKWIRNYAKKNKPDLMIVFLADLVFLCEVATFGLGIKSIASERGTPQIFSALDKIRYEIGYYMSNWVVFQTKDQQKCFFSGIKKKSSVIENPLVARNQKGYEAKADQPSPGNSFMAVGALSQTKGFDVAILAAKYVVEQYEDFQLHIYGDGGDRNKLQQMIVENNLEKNVILMGHSKDVFKNANQYCGFLLSSINEGFSNALLEAINENLPIISTDCKSGAQKAILDNGRRGILVPTNDPRSMAAGIMKVLSDKEEAMQRAILCHQECEAQFGEKVISAKWLDLVEKVLS